MGGRKSVCDKNRLSHHSPLCYCAADGVCWACVKIKNESDCPRSHATRQCSYWHPKLNRYLQRPFTKTRFSQSTHPHPLTHPAPQFKSRLRAQTSSSSMLPNPDIRKPRAGFKRDNFAWQKDIGTCAQPRNVKKLRCSCYLDIII